MKIYNQSSKRQQFDSEFFTTHGTTPVPSVSKSPFNRYFCLSPKSFYRVHFSCGTLISTFLVQSHFSLRYIFAIFIPFLNRKWFWWVDRKFNQTSRGAPNPFYCEYAIFLAAVPKLKYLPLKKVLIPHINTFIMGTSQYVSGDAVLLNCAFNEHSSLDESGLHWLIVRALLTDLFRAIYRKYIIHVTRKKYICSNIKN